MKEIQEIIAIVTDTIQNQLPLIIAYAALLLSLLYKYQYTASIKKNTAKTVEASVKAVQQLEVARETNKNLTQERQEFLKQIKREREMKGEFRHQLETLKNELRRA
jgi:translation initiation factor 2 beta subunit (eIF-2beta)/eIF-5